MKINAITVGLLVMVAPTVTQAKAIPGLGEATFWRESDVEINMDALTPERDLKNRSRNPDQKATFDINGRIRLGVGHTHKTATGVTIDVFAQPTLNLDGKAGVDDAYIAFSDKAVGEGWQIKMGRYEAFNMFPLGNIDTLIGYGGYGHNDKHGGIHAYSYQMKEGRGRADNGGGILLSSQHGPIYTELNTMVVDATKQLNDNTYHGNRMVNLTNQVLVRPVLAYMNGPVTAAVAGEIGFPRVYGYHDTTDGNKFSNQSRHKGLGGTLQYNTLAENPTNGFAVNLSVAAVNMKNERDFSIGLNGEYKNVELGYVYAHNRYDKYTPTPHFTTGKEFNAHTVHAAYRFKDVAGDPNLNVNVGAYTSWLTGKDTDALGHTDFRVQTKYYF